jgi:hypothetical protein
MRYRALISALLIVIIVLLILLFTNQVVAPPELGGTPAISGPSAAVLVVDVFEPLPTTSPEATATPEVTPDVSGDCALTPDGEPHSEIAESGNRAISGAGNRAISGAGNRAISGAGGKIVIDPHGRLVYHEIEALLRTGGGTQAELVLGSEPSINRPWIRDIGRWQTKGGNMVLAAVDTDGYNTDVIGSRIQETVQLLNQRYGITRFVINMSFVVVPCDSVTAPLDYLKILDDPAYQNLKQALDAAIANGEDLVDVMVRQPDFPAFRQDVLNQRTVQFERTLESCYGQPSIPRGTGQTGAAAQQAAPTAAPTLTAAAQPIAPGAGPGTQACQNLLRGNDPLAQRLTQLDGSQLNGGTAQIIAIASSGNRGDSFSFAPGYWPNVVSVGADYTGWDKCDLQTEPLGNMGEVRMSGLYDCLSGTSFAAPRLSYEAGLYLMLGGAMSCNGSDGTSSPPLAYTLDHNGDGIFDFYNWPRVEGADRYCKVFNSTLGSAP